MKSENPIVQKFLDGGMDAGGTIAELEHEVFTLLKANTELAKLTANLIEFLTEVSYKPYNDSDALSLLESLRTRASVILQDIGKDEPLTLTDLPRPWSTDEMKEPTCPGCGAPYVGGEVTTHFHFCPVEKENKPLPPEVYKDFEQGQPFKDER
jgi:hypothetical protein